MIDGSMENLWESTFLVTVRHVLCTDGQITLNKHISPNPREKKTKNPSNTPLANLQSHTSQRKTEPPASGVCGERGAGRLRLVILRRECSPSDGARGPAARHLVRRSPRTPRKAGDGGLTGNTTKPY